MDFSRHAVWLGADGLRWSAGDEPGALYTVETACNLVSHTPPLTDGGMGVVESVLLPGLRDGMQIRIRDVRRDVSLTTRALEVIHATGEWLDVHADGVGLTRRPALKASGLVLFLRDPNYQGGNVRVPAGRIVRTQPDGAGNVYRYVTTADAVLPADADRVSVPVESEDYGAAANAGAGQICELATPVPGVRGVTNEAGWLTGEGADEETDADLQARYELVWRANNGCTKYAYKAWALSVPGVASVEVLDRHPRGQGTVDVVVRGTAIIPTEALLEKVRAAIAPNVPINDDWLVKGPDPVGLGIAGTLECVDVDPELAGEAAELRLRALFLDVSPYEDVTPLAIGQDVPLDLLTHTVMGVRGVKRVTWTAPAADVAVPKSGMAVLDSLSLNTVMAEEA